MAIPHIDEQLDFEPEHYDNHHRVHKKKHEDDRHNGAYDRKKKHQRHEPEPEHQDMQDDDIHRVVHVRDHDGQIDYLTKRGSYKNTKYS